MSTFMNELYFNYDGISSRDYGILSLNTNNDMFSEPILGSIRISDDNIIGSNIPNFKSVEIEPKEFDMVLAFEYGFPEGRELIEMMSWLFSETYKPLYFEGDTDRVYYCMAHGQPNVVHNGTGQGYIELSMRCDSPYVYSQYRLSEKYDFLDNSTGQIVEIENHGNYDLFLEISIDKVGAGDIEIENLSNGGYTFMVMDLLDGESIYIDTEKEVIETDLIGVYRYDNVIGQRIKLGYGKNQLKIIGNCEIQFRYKYKFIM